MPMSVVSYIIIDLSGMKIMSNKIDIHNIVLQLTRVTLLEDKRHRDESIKNLTPISMVHEGGSIKEMSNTFTVSKCSPKYSSNKTIIDDLITDVENEHLFNKYESMPNRDFHISLNKTIYEFLLRKSIEAKETNTWGDDNIWYNPIKEFQNWFDENGIDHNTIPSLTPAIEKAGTNDEPDHEKDKIDYNLTSHLEPSIDKEYTNDALWAIADDMRLRKEMGEFETYRDAYRWAESNLTCDDKIITAIKLERAYHKAKSEGKL